MHSPFGPFLLTLVWWNLTGSVARGALVPVGDQHDLHGTIMNKFSHSFCVFIYVQNLHEQMPNNKAEFLAE